VNLLGTKETACYCSKNLEILSARRIALFEKWHQEILRWKLATAVTFKKFPEAIGRVF
jgi:hypothetical protein